MGRLCDVGGVDQVVVRVSVFAVAAFQSFDKLDQSLHRDLKNRTRNGTKNLLQQFFFLFFFLDTVGKSVSPLIEAGQIKESRCLP